MKKSKAMRGLIGMRGLTFKNGTDVFPYGYGAGPVELSQRQLHVEEGDAPEDGHQDVGDQESTWMGEETLKLFNLHHN